MSLNQFHPLKVASVARNTRDAVVVTFDLPDTLADEFAFLPGQYLTLRTQLNGEEPKRFVSLGLSADSRGTRRLIATRAPVHQDVG